MVIIIEGIDRVGKTTLCKRLSETLNIPIYKHVGEFKYSKMDNENETDKMLQIIEICKLSNSFIIFDRFHLTDFVYGVLEREYDSHKAENNKNEIEEKLNEIGAILIVVNPTSIVKSSKEHGKDLMMHNQLFKTLFSLAKIKNKIECDYTSFDEVEEFIRKVVNKSV